MTLLSGGRDLHSRGAVTVALLHLQERVVLWQFRVLISGNEGSTLQALLSQGNKECRAQSSIWLLQGTGNIGAGVPEY